ncbi:lisH domain-containing protein FOPNL isoform X5 [Mus caroli]|uniref:LisH domain-containing protein FOPNL isoform X5 n=1 Tax=Mus caroli TaxID=10089 RepID=A0A6P7Q7I2_MUSCR|nr:lisH domain-containing protein FOPNL isoform X5 [Mus caroli]
MATVTELKAESGQPVVPLDRQFLIRELNAFEESKDNSIPLLYGILAHFLRGPPDGAQNVLLTESTLHPASKHVSWKPSRRPDGRMISLLWWYLKQNCWFTDSTSYLNDHVRKDTGPRTTTEELPAAAQAVSR